LKRANEKGIKLAAIYCKPAEKESDSNMRAKTKMSKRVRGNSQAAYESTAELKGYMAVPIFMGRVAPVLDTCTRLLVVDRSGDISSGHKVLVRSRTIPERVQEFMAQGICVIICGALSDLFFSYLTEKGIHMICGIAGDIDEVIAAYKKGTLWQSCFRMPGAGQLYDGEHNEP
jgi:predicted Fe-Mo cluster-binding NifX family protein